MRLIVLLLALVATAGCDRHKTDVQQGVAADSTPAKGLDRSRAGSPIPDVELGNGDGEPASLAELSGKPLLINLWATWCAPCVKELPTLEALSRKPGAPRVIAVSQDLAPRGSVDAFLDTQRLTDIEVWHDPKMALSGELGAQILPTTIFYGADGREKWRFVGDLDWTGAEAARLLSEAR